MDAWKISLEKDSEYGANGTSPNDFEDWVRFKLQEVEQKVDDHAKASDIRISEFEGKLESGNDEVVAADSAIWQSTRSDKVLDRVSIENEQAEGSFTLSEDVYMVLASSKWTSPSFWLSILVIFGFQYAMLIVLIADRIDIESSNPLRLPANAESTVRFAQTLAIFIAIFTQNDLLIGMQTLFEGLPEACRGGVGSQRFQNMSPFQWYSACLYKTIQGALSLIAAFILIMQSETVFDVLLNFLGMSFVGDIDDQAFELAARGYFGKSAEQTVQDIQETEFYRQKREGMWIKRVAHVIASLFVLFAMLFGFVVLLSRQNAGVYSVNDIQVEFGDNVIPFLGLFSGCYEATDVDGFGERRLLYQQVTAQKDGGKFGYCGGINGGVGGWTFFIGELRDPCDYLLRSGATDTFNVVEAVRTKWYTADNRPLDLLEMNRADNPLQECGREVFETSFEEVCGRIEGLAEGSLEILPVDDLLDKRENFDSFTSRPVYFSKAPNPRTNATEIAIFTGHRWILTDSNQLVGLNSIASGDVTVNVLQAFFYGDQVGFKSTKQIGEWVHLVSERVEFSNNEGSPLGLLWFYPRYDEDAIVDFPAADITRPMTSPFSCGFCDDDNNPCFYEGKCNIETGLCNCTHGASGALCQEKPLGNGICNVYFNKEEFGYDGGDCCPGTCVGPTCGEDDLPSPFFREFSGFFSLIFDDIYKGRRYPFGVSPEPTTEAQFSSKPFWFEHCIDPRMAKVALEVSPLNDNGFAAFIPVTVRCDGILYFQLPELDLLTNDTEVFIQELSLPYGSLCTFDFPMETDFATVYESISVVAGDMNEAFMYKTESRCSFDLRIPESQCVWETLISASIAIHSDLDATCSSEVSSQPSLSVIEFEGMGSELSLDRICRDDRGQLLERYAVRKLTDIVQNGVTVTSEQHLCDGIWNFDGFEIDCNESEHVVGLQLSNLMTNSLPSEIKFLSSLESLALYNPSQIEFLPIVEIESLTHLTSLEISSNPIKQLPNIGRLTNLVSLSVDSTHITEIPSSVGELAALSYLYLAANQLTTLPTEIGRLGSLSLLDASYNQILQLPTEIGTLSLLDTLHLEHNNLTQIPSEAGDLSSLSLLVVTSNRLTRMPSEIGKLSQLAYLSLDHNVLSELPSEVGNLYALDELEVSYNSELLSKSPPDELVALFMLKGFDCISDYYPEDTDIQQDWCDAIRNGP